jgi:hypothetical protein
MTNDFNDATFRNKLKGRGNVSIKKKREKEKGSQEKQKEKMEVFRNSFSNCQMNDPTVVPCPPQPRSLHAVCPFS